MLQQPQLLPRNQASAKKVSIIAITRPLSILPSHLSRGKRWWGKGKQKGGKGKNNSNNNSQTSQKKMKSMISSAIAESMNGMSKKEKA